MIYTAKLLANKYFLIHALIQFWKYIEWHLNFLKLEIHKLILSWIRLEQYHVSCTCITCPTCITCIQYMYFKCMVTSRGNHSTRAMHCQTRLVLSYLSKLAVEICHTLWGYQLSATKISVLQLTEPNYSIYTWSALCN